MRYCQFPWPCHYPVLSGIYHHIPAYKEFLVQLGEAAVFMYRPLFHLGWLFLTEFFYLDWKADNDKLYQFISLLLYVKTFLFVKSLSLYVKTLVWILFKAPFIPLKCDFFGSFVAYFEVIIHFNNHDRPGDFSIKLLTAV